MPKFDRFKEISFAKAKDMLNYICILVRCAHIIFL